MGNFAFVLFYKPPCGTWYVHSHKTYPTIEAANESAKKFLPAGTEIVIQHIDLEVLEMFKGKVDG